MHPQMSLCPIRWVLRLIQQEGQAGRVGSRASRPEVLKLRCILEFAYRALKNTDVSGHILRDSNLVLVESRHW